MNGIKHDKELVSSTSGLHIHTPNEYISSFQERKTKRERKVYISSNCRAAPSFKKKFCKFGECWELTGDIFNGLQEFVCRLNAMSKKDTGKAKGILLEDCILDDNYHKLYVTVDEGESYSEN